MAMFGASPSFVMSVLLGAVLFLVMRRRISWRTSGDAAIVFQRAMEEIGSYACLPESMKWVSGDGWSDCDCPGRFLLIRAKDTVRKYETFYLTYCPSCRKLSSGQWQLTRYEREKVESLVANKGGLDNTIGYPQIERVGLSRERFNVNWQGRAFQVDLGEDRVQEV